jgi:competence ComEA-like helix-hairpin-helix protein
VCSRRRCPGSGTSGVSDGLKTDSALTRFRTLPGVGASTAQRIADYRQKNGNFKKIEEMLEVQ